MPVENTTKKYRNIVKQLNDEKAAHKKEKLEHSLTKDALIVMEQDRDSWRETFRKLEKEGGLFYELNSEDCLISAVIVPPYALSTYPQEIDESLITKGVYKVVNGKMEIDKEKYNTYKTGGIL